MKFAILTHPLHGNYGGMLQAYALQLTVSRFDHDVSVLLYETKKSDMTKPINHARKLKHFVFACMWQLGIPLSYKTPPPVLFSSMAKNFVQKHISSLKLTLHTNRDEYRLIVGSDQVWRGVYARSMVSFPFYFGDFVSPETRAKSFVYAASFGTNQWEGTSEETLVCANLLKQYKSVSVRENSGIAICKEQLHTKAVQMPDPTLLLFNEDYGRLIASEKTRRPAKKYAAAYILDYSEAIDDTLQFLSEKTHLPMHRIMPQATAAKYSGRIPCTPEQWLRTIRDCEYLITDSFHGCVFAIIFNKPFVCLGNINRGSTRFDALFETFCLKNRICTSLNGVYETLLRPIDWNTVNSIREKERSRGLQFLGENLNTPFSSDEVSR